MFLRQPSGLKVQELRETIAPAEGRVKVLTTDQVRIDVEGDDRSIDLDGTEVPLTEDSYQPIGKWLDVPYKFLKRQDRDLQQILLERLLRQTRGEFAIEYSPDHGIMDIRDPGMQVIDPRRLVDLAGRVIDPQADVVEFHSTPEWIQFDIVVPEGYDHGWGGDRQVDDVTAGGLRFGQNRKRNLAPWVSAFFYRLACTNGYERFDERFKVDARGQSPDDLLADLEAKARLAFTDIEAEIAAFYQMREEQVGDPSQAVLRIASEVGLPDRTAMALVNRVPEVIEDPSSATMFDIVNLVTNQANDPSIQNRLGVRRQLEQAGGDQISDHIARCRSCASRLNN